MGRLAVLFLALLGTLACSTRQAASDREPFQEVIQAALTAEHNSFVPDPPVCPGPVSETMRQQLIAELPNKLSAYFGQPQLDNEISIATAALRDKDGPACVYGGGVDWVRLDDLSVNGTNAAGAGQVRMWARVAQWQGRPIFAEPHNNVDATFHFSNVSGRWVITQYQWRFASGSEP